MGRARAARFGREDGTSFEVTSYGGEFYTVEGNGHPLVAFKEISEALNSIGFTLPFPAALQSVDPQAFEFFHSREGTAKSSATATFEIPSMDDVAAMRP